MSFERQLVQNIKKNSKFFYFLILIYLCILIIFSSYQFFLNKHDKINIQNQSQKIRVFCMIFTYDQKIATRAFMVYNTWAQRCDDFKFVLKLTPNLSFKNKKVYLNGIDIGLPADSIIDPGIENEKYRKLTDKTYRSLIYVKNHFGNFDWYLKADDDTYVFIDNLRKFVINKNASEPVTFGFDFKRYVDEGYHSGGAGYLMSREAINRIATKLEKNYSFCPNRGVEDVDVAACFRSVEVHPGLSRDFFGKERFHPLPIKSLYYGRFPKWFLKYSAQAPAKVF